MKNTKHLILTISLLGLLNLLSFSSHAQITLTVKRISDTEAIITGEGTTTSPRPAQRWARFGLHNVLNGTPSNITISDNTLKIGSFDLVDTGYFGWGVPAPVFVLYFSANVPSNLAITGSAKITLVGATWKDAGSSGNLWWGYNNSLRWSVNLGEYNIEDPCDGVTLNPVITKSTNEICVGETAVLSVDTYDSYLWSNGATTQSISVNPTNNTQYSVTVLNECKCTGVVDANITVSQMLTFDTDNATQSTTSTGMILYNFDVCGDLTDFTNNFTSTGGFASAQFFPSSNSNCQQARITYGSGVDWTFTVSSANGCDTTIESDDATVGGVPVLIFEGFTVTPETCPNDLDGALAISVTGGDTSCGDYTFSWTGPNSFTSTSQNLTGIASGSYDVTITDCAGTSVTANQYVNRNSGGGRGGRGRGRGGCKTALEQLVLDFQLQPNPATDFVQVSFEVEGDTEDFNISLIDLAGRTLQEIRIEGDGMMSLDISSVSNGMYIVQLQSQNQVIRQEKLVIVK